MATAVANSPASVLLSPSKTNCNRDAVGIGHRGGIELRIRRVSPPPGMKGIAVSFTPFCEDESRANVYGGNSVKACSTVVVKGGLFGGWI